MAETNGHQNGNSRLDRVEAALNLMIQDHEEFRSEHKRLLAAQVVFQDNLNKLTERVDGLALSMRETDGKLNALIDVVDRNSREFHGRLKRLEEKELNG